MSYHESRVTVILSETCHDFHTIVMTVRGFYIMI